MKKMLSVLLVITLFVMTMVPAYAETAPLTEMEILQTLKAKQVVNGFFIPVLPEGYEIEGITVEKDGSYSYAVQSPTAADIYLENIAIVRSTNTNVLNSPYQCLLASNGVEACVNVSDEMLDSLDMLSDAIVHTIDYNHSRTYQFNGAIPVTYYGGYPATIIGWNVTFRNYGDISLGSGREVVMQLDQNTMLSYFFQFNVSADEINENGGSLGYLSEHFPLVFIRSGDVDGDMTVNAVDALAMLKHAVGKEMITDEKGVILADCDNNGIINAADALYALKVAVGKA